MAIFPERLKQLRGEYNTTQVQLAAAVGLTDRACQKYEYGKIQPTLPVLIAIADYFDVSLDYLVGRSDNPKRR